MTSKQEVTEIIKAIESQAKEYWINPETVNQELEFKIGSEYMTAHYYFKYRENEEDIIEDLDLYDEEGDELRLTKTQEEDVLMAIAGTIRY